METATILPTHIFIETVAGICNNRCIMCPIGQSRRKEIMTNDRFEKILKKLAQCLNNQKFLSFCGLGETLIDPCTNEKIKIAKQLGFRGIGIYTNGMSLDPNTSEKLLDAELDTLIISIDGFTQKTQATIRTRSNLEKITSNLKIFFTLRESQQSKTKVIIRFHRQELNKHEENDFCNFWRARIKSSYGDAVTVYNIHNIGGSISGFNDKLDDKILEQIKSLKCPEIYDRLLIASDGSINFCCGDLFGHYHVGNILDDDLVQLYNSKYYVLYREMMERGRILNLELCKNCSVPYSIITRKTS